MDFFCQSGTSGIEHSWYFILAQLRPGSVRLHCQNKPLVLRLIMRRFARSLLYVALSGFVITMILNLSHRSDTARTVYITGCVCAVLGILVMFFLPIDAHLPNKAAASRVPDKIAYLGSFFALTGLAMRWFYAPGGELLMEFGFFLIVLFFFIVLFRFIFKKKQVVRTNHMSFSSGELDPYPGTYSNADLKMKIVVSKDTTGSKLIGRTNDEPDQQLEPVDNNKFNFSGTGIFIEINPDSDKYFLIKHNGYYPLIKEM